MKESVGKYVDEVSRVLKSGGQWICMTFIQPHFLRSMLTRENVWSLETECFDNDGGGFEYFAFIMTKCS